MTIPNPSTAQARAIADEFQRHGVSLAVISPGSRSAALAIALDQHPGIETVVALDERSAAFHALGRARATGRPSLALATSGTAVANFLPAVVEADLSLVPLILLSADRPPELRGTGSNQTIDQIGIFGDRVRWFLDLPPAEPGRDLNSYWRSAVSQVVARAMGHGARPGPAHVNVAFREPTVPVADDGRTTSEPYPHGIEGRDQGRPWQSHQRARSGPAPFPSAGARRALIIAGEGDYSGPDLVEQGRRLGWPVLATAASGPRGDETVTTYHHLLVDGVPESLRPDLVLTVGRIGPSDRLARLTELDVPQVQIDPWGVWNDPRRHSTHLLEAGPVSTLAGVGDTSEPGWAESWRRADDAMRSALDEVIGGGDPATGPGVARSLSGIEARAVVVASSMPIRDVDAHAALPVGVVSNRGASGIDGFVSTALGVASALSPCLAVCGDLSFLHDAGGLVTDRLPEATFVVIDNGGGGLFDLLPQAEHAPGYERLFVAPHRLELESLARAYGLQAEVVSAPGELGSMLRTALGSAGPRLLVVPVDRETDLKMRHALDETARSLSARLS